MALSSRPLFHALLIASLGLSDQPEEERFLETSTGSKYYPWLTRWERGLCLQQGFRGSS